MSVLLNFLPPEFWWKEINKLQINNKPFINIHYYVFPCLNQNETLEF
jgi:hypothetical protein